MAPARPRPEADPAPAGGPWRFNEVHRWPTTDVNCDGSVDEGDRFVELVGLAPDRKSLSGFRLQALGPEGEEALLTFPDLELEGAVRAVVVFAAPPGGPQADQACLLPPDVPQLVSERPLPPARSWSLIDPSGQRVAEAVLPPGQEGQSTNRLPDLRGEAWASHGLQSTRLASPGVRPDGQAYGREPQQLETGLPDETGDTAQVHDTGRTWVDTGPFVEPPPRALKINEVLVDAGGSQGDANCDGRPDEVEDEFVELINRTGELVELRGSTLSDSFGVRHVFPPGSALGPHEVMVVFGGGSPSFTAETGPCRPLPEGVHVQVASSGALALSNTGDTLRLSSPAGVLLQELSWSHAKAADQSLNRSIDLTETEFIPHLSVPGALGPHSAGRRVNGQPLSEPPEPPPEPPPPGSLILHEVHFAPNPLGGGSDTNCDGLFDAAQDEFVELLNVGSAEIDLTGVSLHDEGGLRHLFTGGTLGVGHAVVLWGGGSPDLGSGVHDNCRAHPRAVTVATASTGRLDLDNVEDSLSLYAHDGSLLDFVTYRFLALAPGSITRQPQATAGEWVLHALVPDTIGVHSAGRTAQQTSLWLRTSEPRDTAAGGETGGADTGRSDTGE